MDLGIKSRHALIFGGSRGIGRAVAGALAAEGTDVAVCAPKEWAAQKVATEVAKNNGVRAAGYKIDAWDEPSTNTLISRIVEDFGAIDILFGVARRAALENRNVLPEGGWQPQLDRGFLRFKAATETLLPGMRERQWGRILWMIPWPTAGTSIERQLYSVMTASLSAWLESIAVDLAKDNVNVNLLRPAPVSKITGREFEGDSGHTKPQRSFMPMPADDTLSVQQVAATAAFLLSEPASGVYGRAIELGRTREGTPTRLDGRGRQP